MGESRTLEPIAICGMAMRLPGGIKDSQAFWDALVEKKDLRSPVPADRFNIEAFYSDCGKHDMIRSREGYYLTDEELGHLDTSFFPMRSRDLLHTDPQLKMLLELTQECLENAGEASWQGQRVGCYVGTYGDDWLELGRKDIQDTNAFGILGSADFNLSNRISYQYDMRGPSMTIKTACSSAMMCLNEACWAIANGQCDSAIVAGSNLIFTPTTTSVMSPSLLSPTESCKAFDAAADGYARGEAVNVIFIKRLSDALQAGNAIRAVIRGIGVSSSGHTDSVTAPSPVGQESLIRAVYRSARLPFGETGFFECHGTGTRVGDPIEANVVGKLFGDTGIHIGSAKPNFGHSEGASAITSVIKAVLALENKAIPPNMHFSTPNPNIDFESGRLTVPHEVTPWPRSRAIRISLNSFGIAGTNGHAILESADYWHTNALTRVEQNQTPSTKLLVLSATHKESLTRLKEAYGNLIRRSVHIGDLAFTLGACRQHHKFRSVCVYSGREKEPAFRPSAQILKLSQTVFVFSGQGVSWPRMGANLLQQNAVFLRTFRTLDRVLSGLQECTFSLEEELLRNKDQSRVQEAEISQPLSTAIQICLCDALSAVAVTPAAVIGHSSGEIAAAYAAGALSAEQAITVAFFRGQVLKGQQCPGGMVSIGLNRDLVQKIQLHGATLAADNSPSNVTLSGGHEVIEKAIEIIEDQYPDCLVRKLNVDKAYHSHHMQSLGQRYETLLRERVTSIRPIIPFFSTLLGRQLNEDETLDPTYWRRNMESPVLFRDAVEQTVSAMKKSLIFAEIGSHPTLSGSLIQTAAGQNVTVSYVSFMRKSSIETEAFYQGLGKLYELGAVIDFNALNPNCKVLTDLPTYPWQHETRHWSESRLSRDWRFRKYAPHDLLGVKTAESSGIQPSWRNVLRADNVDWLKDHRLGEHIVMPFTAFCCMAGEAIQQIHEVRSGFTLRHVVVRAPLVVPGDDAVEIFTMLQQARLTDSLDSAWSEFSICSFSGSQWIKHCTGHVRIGRDPSLLTKTSSASPCAREVTLRTWYDTMQRIGLSFGPRFQGMQSILAHVENHEATAMVRDERSEQDSPYELHPGTIDSALQLIGVAASRGLSRDTRSLLIPTRCDIIYIQSASEPITLRARAEVTHTGPKSGDVTGYSGIHLVLQVEGLRLSLMDASLRDRDLDPHAAAELVWLPDASIAGFQALAHCNTNQQIVKLVQLLAHANPLLSILEMRDGSNDETESILTSLTTDAPNETTYSAYTIAHPDDVSQSSSQERFKKFERVAHVQYDQSHGLILHGSVPRSYDLILAKAEALSSIDMETYLQKIKMIMRADGRLILYPAPSSESQSKPQDPNGNFLGLQNLMHAVELSQMEILHPEGSPLHTENVIVAKAAPAAAVHMNGITLLCTTTNDPTTHEISSLFYGIEITTLSLEEATAESLAERTVVSIIDLQGTPALLDMSPLWFEELKRLFQSVKQGILWLTRPCQLGPCPDPNYAMILGLARTVRAEFQIGFYTLEIPDHSCPGAGDAIRQVLGKMLQNHDQLERAEEVLDPDYEYAFHDGCLHIPRFHWTSVREALPHRQKDQMEDKDTAEVLKVATRGRLDSLYWTTRKLKPFKHDSIQIQVKAVGVNFKDILICMGAIDVAEEGLGLEGAGIVERVGQDVVGLKPGDRVMFCGTAAYGSRVRYPEAVCSKIADDIGFEQAATMPCVYLTVMYSLMDLGHLKRGESVLIHSGCGGVGIAAIQLAQMIGAEIFVTVGSEMKVQHLVQNFAIPRNHIFNSRDSSFYNDLMQQTSGRGADVVLNSLSGELLHASWNCVAKFGRMIEIGKRDILESGKLEMNRFADNRSYSCLSLEEVCQERPEIAKRLFSQLQDLLQRGLVKPISPMTTFAATTIEECFRSMQKGQHIGKLVVQLPEDKGSLPLTRPVKTLRLDQEASYLLVGGFGGIGRGVARYIVESGASNLIFLSRTAGTKDEHVRFMDELHAMGCSCWAVAGDVTDLSVVENLVATAVPPIKGVVQASMILKEQALPNMALEDWTTSVDPKVKGTWNLHNALLPIGDLDFFVGLGSISGVIGQHGQSNYNAANTFMDAFVTYRHGLHLPASILNIGAVGDIGILSNRPDLLRRMQAFGMYTLYERDILDAFHWAIDNSRPWLQTEKRHTERSSLTLGLRSTMPIQDQNNHIPWKRDRRMAFYYNSAYASPEAASQSQEGKASSQQLLDIMGKIRADPQKELADSTTARILAEEIGKKVFKMLLRAEDELYTSMTLASVGMDSLVAIEMKRWWRDAFGVEVSVLQVANVATFNDLGDLAVALLKRRWLKKTPTSMA